MNFATFDYLQNTIRVFCQPENDYLVRQIRGARKDKHGWIVPSTMGWKVAALSRHGFEIDDSVPTDKKEPEIIEQYDSLIVYFPDDRGFAKIAKKLGGRRQEGVRRGHDIWEFPKTKRDKLDAAFAGIQGAEFVSRHDKENRKGVDVDAVRRELGDLSLPLANGKTLYRHQRETVETALKSEYGAIIGLDYGLGKTLVSALMAGAIQRVHNYDVVVLCPATLKDNWLDEMEGLVDNPLIYSDHFSSIPDSHHAPFVLIADEAHRLTADSQRAGAFVSLCYQAEYVMPLTGAPVRHGRPETAYNLLLSVGHSLADVDRETFRLRFENDLQSFYELTQGVIIRKTKKECLDLPPETRILRPVAATEQDIERYESALAKATELYQLAVKRGEKEKVYFKSALVHYVRRASSLAKVGEALLLVEELLEQGRQPVIFVSYRETARLLVEAIDAPLALINGDTPQEDRQPLVKEFQEGKRRVAILSHQTAGFGLTLTASDIAILIDRPFTVEPNDTQNSEHRLYRIGQDKPVTYVWLQFLHESLKSPDKRIDAAIIEKHAKNEMALSGRDSEMMFRLDNELELEKYLFST